jgi:DNA-binding NarL/FixJ family response regulator
VVLAPPVESDSYYPRFLDSVSLIDSTEIDDATGLAPKMRLRVVVVDDSPPVLRQLIYLLGTEFDVVGSAEEGQMALDVIQNTRPDVVVLDLEMPLRNGIEVTRELRKLGPSPVVVICSVDTDPEIIEAALQAGALGYVSKMLLTNDLVRAVELAARGESFVSSS